MGSGLNSTDIEWVFLQLAIILHKTECMYISKLHFYVFSCSKNMPRKIASIEIRFDKDFSSDVHG